MRFSHIAALVDAVPAAVRRTLTLAVVLIVAMGALAFGKSRYDESLIEKGRKSVVVTRIVREIVLLDSSALASADSAKKALADYKAKAKKIRSDTSATVPRPQVEDALNAADRVAAKDSTALADCNKRAAARDTLIRYIKEPARNARLLPFADVLYGPQDRSISLRGSATYRVTPRFAALGEIEHTFGRDTTASRTQYRLGGRIAF